MLKDLFADYILLADESVRILSSANNVDNIYLSITQKLKSCSFQAFIHNIHIQEKQVICICLVIPHRTANQRAKLNCSSYYQTFKI